jgi:hypothetical protein
MALSFAFFTFITELITSVTDLSIWGSTFNFLENQNITLAIAGEYILGSENIPDFFSRMSRYLK